MRSRNGPVNLVLKTECFNLHVLAALVGPVTKETQSNTLKALDLDERDLSKNVMSPSSQYIMVGSSSRVANLDL